MSSIRIMNMRLQHVAKDPIQSVSLSVGLDSNHSMRKSYWITNAIRRSINIRNITGIATPLHTMKLIYSDNYLDKHDQSKCIIYNLNCPCSYSNSLGGYIIAKTVVVYFRCGMLTYHCCTYIFFSCYTYFIMSK